MSLKENDKENSIKFINQENEKNYFYLLFNIKQNEEGNILIIYAELILYNKTGMNISYKFEEKKNLICFEACKNIHIISSKIDFKEEKIKLICDDYKSHKILISQFIEASPFIKVNMENNSNRYLNFNIKQKLSYIKIVNNPNFKENIRSIVFTILPYCRIFNLLSTKRFLIVDYNNNKNSFTIDPLEKTGFQFFRKGLDSILGISAINLNSNKITHLIKCQFNIGIYTLTTDDYTFNLEIKQNPNNGCLEVLENLSDEGILLYQKNYEKKYTQILYPKEIQPLKLYDYYSLEFYIQINQTFKAIQFDKIGEKEKKFDLTNRIMLLIEANGIKIKGTFYLIEEYKKLKTILIYKNYSFNINKIYISIIGDNEFSDTKLVNYKRNELLLFYFSDFSLALNIKKTKGHLNKDYIKSNLILNDFKIYNQASKIGHFACVFGNNTSPFLNLYNEINFYNKLKIAKIEQQNIKVGKIELGIDPHFVTEIFNFFDNILYRMNITNFNVHKIFLKEKESDPKKLIKKYNEGDILINAIQLLYPELNIEFELSKIGLKQLLKERMGCSEFYIFLVNGLIGNKQNIILENSLLDFKNGGIERYLKWIYFQYLEKIQNQITKFGFKGMLGQIKNMFSFDRDDDEKYKNAQINRLRMPRVFYGKFKYFKEYNEEDAILIKNTFHINKQLKIYYPTRIIKGNKEFFLFTTIAMFRINCELSWNIDYYYIKTIKRDKLNIKVDYNQEIDSKTCCIFKCENEEIAQSVVHCLNEEKINNKEKILEL